MRQYFLIGFIFVAFTLLNCSKIKNEQFIGEWKLINDDKIINFKSDGKGYVFYDSIYWKISNTNPNYIECSFFKYGRPITFFIKNINENEMTLKIINSNPEREFVCQKIK